MVNKLIRDALYQYPEDLKLVTKVGGRRDDVGGWHPALSPAELRAAVEDNLRTLRLERMDSSTCACSTSTTPMAGWRNGWAPWRISGRRASSTSSGSPMPPPTPSAERLSSWTSPAQNAFSVVNRAEEDELELCEERELAFVPFFPLGSAFAGGPRQLAADPAIAEVAARHEAAPSQIALAWLLDRSARILLIPGDELGRPPGGEPRRRRHRARC